MRYETVVGLEVHVQLNTRTKMFCPATCDFGHEPNTQVDPTSLGLPGSLPVANRHAVELAVTAALALDGRIQPHSRFDRKHYFYPDLPKNYQISQFDEPYCVGGRVLIDDGEGVKAIPLTRIHMEEDAGKLVHQESGPFSEVDLNRAGTPLIEIVSEPAIRSGAEAYAYLVELRRVLRWCGVSDCEMQEGSLRCDANISVRPEGATTLGTKVEVKNLNSLRAVEAAIEVEAALQMALHRAGRATEIIQQTKLWDPDAKTTRPMRGKEGSADYRYFPDPDLPPLVITEPQIAARRAALGELPRARAERFVRDLGLSPQLARDLTMEKRHADFFEDLVRRGSPARIAANWVKEEALRPEREDFIWSSRPGATVSHSEIASAWFNELIHLVDSGKVARVVAKGECETLFAGTEPPTAYFQACGMIQQLDAGALDGWVTAVIAQEAKAVADIQAGKLAALGRLVGAVMKTSGGKADPKQVQAALKARLGLG